MKNYYQILGVQPSASHDDIKAAFKKLSKKVHPDVNWGGQIFEELFKDINEAHQVLSDGIKRAEYNQRFNHFFFNPANFSGIETHEPPRLVHRSNEALKRKVVRNGSVCLFLLFGFIIINAFVFDNEDHTAMSGNLYANVQHVAAIAPQPVEKKDLLITSPTDSKEALVSEPIAAIDVIPEPVKQKHIPLIPKNNIVKEETKPDNKIIAKPIPPIPGITWSEQQMNGIVEMINVEKKNSVLPVTCIKLVQSSNSNVSNAFALAKYLQAHHFVIAGRETSSKPCTGVSFESSGNCMTVKIGLMK